MDKKMTNKKLDELEAGLLGDLQKRERKKAAGALR
jgi:hypothetical protein